MKRTAVILLLAIICLPVSITPTAHAADLKRLTQFYTPERWQLYPLYPNPFSPCYQTEFIIPDTVHVTVDVFLLDHEGKTRTFVRHLVSPECDLFVPAVYSLDYWDLSDSLGLPLSDGLYRIVVAAYDHHVTDSLVFADSLFLLATSGNWRTLDPQPSDFDVTILDKWNILPGQTLAPTDVLCQYSEMEVTAARLRKGIDSLSPDKIVVKLNDALASEYGLDSFRGDADGYICVKDSTAPSGYRILQEISPWGDEHSVWPLSLDDGELLMIDCVSHWPVVIDPSRFIDRLRSEGTLK